jgi:ectoine hydroxylase-related dioxygenase (phytanoyl-CoA dioxygenase family)
MTAVVERCQVKPFDRATFIDEIYTQGYSIVANVLSPDFIARAKRELADAIEKEVAYHKGSTTYQDYGMVMLCSLYGGALLDLFDNDRLLEPFESILGRGCTVYAYTSSSMPPAGRNHSARVHVDCPRVIPGYITNLGATILLDDFTEDNGATWFLPGSQERLDPPGDDEFRDQAVRLIAPAGSVWFFNARIWHAGGVNRTHDWRHALTINMCRPWMKQRLDIPRAMAHMDLSTVSERAKQKLGFLARVPASYDEYYVPLEQRTFKQPME